MPALRLSQKLVIAFAMVILVVVTLVTWNLFTADRLSRENRAIVQEALPAVRLEVALRDSVSALRRLEARYAVLRDPAYLNLFHERAQVMASDFSRLESLLSTEEEREGLRQAMARLGDYRRLVEVRRVVSSQGGAASSALEASLERLYAKSESELRRREAGAQALNEKTRLLAWGGLAASMLVGFGVSAFAVFRIARPLRRLQLATQEVAEREFHEPIVVHGRDEVAELTREFNRMGAKLKELDSLKEEFFAAISHDLRTPLTAIRESARLLQEGNPGPLTPKQERLVKISMIGSDRLLRLINQILALGTLKAGTLRLDLRPTDLRRVIEASVDEIRSLAEEGGLELELSIPENLPKVVADEERIHQVLVNLLGNAVKFTRNGGRITVSAEVEGGDMVVKVADTGIGIPSHMLPKIFERYQQAHTNHGGTGIGLAVVKGFVEAHGGTVRAESEEGRGSRFTVTLPLEAAAR